MSCGEVLAPSIAEASERIVASLLNGGKVVACGNGFGYSLADIFTQCLLLKYQLERPGFPAILLASQPGVITGSLQQQGPAGLFSNQIYTLGNEGDLLITISLGDNPGNLVKAIQSAHDREMSVIALSTINDSDIAASLTGSDLQINVANAETARVAEIHLLCLFLLCDLVDHQLFGGTT